MTANEGRYLKKIKDLEKEKKHLREEIDSYKECFKAYDCLIAFFAGGSGKREIKFDEVNKYFAKFDVRIRSDSKKRVHTVEVTKRAEK